MNAHEILTKADFIIKGHRNNMYGKPEDSFTHIAALWGDYLDRDISPRDVAMMMVLLKIARSQHDENYTDNYVDICGYAALAGGMTNGDE